jgi:chromosomal replication initiation ATPase DnaA
MLNITTAQSGAIHAALLNAEMEIQNILKHPVKVLLTQPRVTIGNQDFNAWVENLFEAIQKATGYNADDIRSRSRNRNLVVVRHITYKLIYESHFKPSLKQVGTFFYRHHSSIIHGLSTINHDLIHIEEVRRTYNYIQSFINNQQSI